ncbi:hypothetical protein QIS99_31235 [Streptomyces sp. B-S-A8]|uniref:Uncharacterized protein n=1 Tax=Streptomyces solicavernae TaxID=3043614 RepID=A0ABT6S1S5_9ACTN|nr:hypothetical protein [Streptomyces sp. B-S-A8]MDI3390636.1 hypothetical protein [Streptomyces sp. B-S-A8]
MIASDVPGGDVPAWSRALKDWLTRAPLREQLRAEAGRRLTSLPYWHHTAADVARALNGETAVHPKWPTVFTMPYPWPPKVSH